MESFQIGEVRLHLSRQVWYSNRNVKSKDLEKQLHVCTDKQLFPTDVKHLACNPLMLQPSV